MKHTGVKSFIHQNGFAQDRGTEEVNCTGTAPMLINQSETVSMSNLAGKNVLRLPSDGDGPNERLLHSRQAAQIVLQFKPVKFCKRRIL